MASHIKTFLGMPARKMPATKSHRPAVWEAMLGTVYAFNGQEVKYFDYNWDEALAFAGFNMDGDKAAWDENDARIARKSRNVSYTGSIEEPRKGKVILWIRKKD